MRAIYISFLVFFTSVLAHATAVGGQFQPQAQTQQVLDNRGGFNNGQNNGLDELRLKQEGISREINGIDQQIATESGKLAKPRRSLATVKPQIAAFLSKVFPALVAEHPLVKVAEKQTITGKIPNASGGGTADSTAYTHPNQVLRAATGEMAQMIPDGRKLAEIDPGDEDVATPEASMRVIGDALDGFTLAAKQIKVPGGYGTFPAKQNDAEVPADVSPIPPICERLSLSKCFQNFLDAMSKEGSTAYQARGANSQPIPAGRSASYHVPKLYRVILGLDWLFERVAIAGTSTADLVTGFFGGKVRGTGYSLLMSHTALKPGQDFAALEAANTALRGAKESNEAHQGGVESALGTLDRVDKGTFFRVAAHDLTVAGSNALTVVDAGREELKRLRDMEVRSANEIKQINDTIAGLENQKQALQDEMNDAAEDALSDSGQGQGQGGASGGGGSGAGGGGGGGEGLQAAKGSDPVKLESNRLPGFPDAGNLSSGLNGLLSPSAGFPDRGALPTGNFQIPKLESTREAPTRRTQPFSYASGPKNVGQQIAQGKTGSPIGGGGGAPGGDPGAAGAAGGGTPPVAGGGAPGGGGGGNVPNVGEGGGGGEERGTTASFVRTTDYGGGAGEGGAGAGPDNGGNNEASSIGAKIAAATGGGGVGFAAREIKANPRAKGMGLMAYVGGFRDFCAEKRALGVGACGAGRGETGRAFRSPGNDSVGNLVAQRVNASASTPGSVRGFTTITK